MDRIVLSGMRFEGRHGASEEERELPQLLEVDLEVEADLAAASESDDLADTIDYGPLVAIVQRMVEDTSVKLLERLAGVIAAEVLAASPRAGAVRVRVRKLAVPLAVDMDHAAVELRRERPPG